MNKTKILVIDDDVNATRMVKWTLERTGRYEVQGLNDPTQAVAAARSFKPGLVMLDICMPNAEGVDVAFQIRSEKEFERIPVVFLSSLVSEREAMGDGSCVGAFHFVAKPPRLDRMIACIENNLEMAHASEQLSERR